MAAQSDNDGVVKRREFLGAASSTIMTGGLAAGYGLFVAHSIRFLYPSPGARKAWQFVTTLDRLKVDESVQFQTPTGAKVVIARHGAGETVDQFVALSSVCPHLGCAVHWESQRDRFFCPCHNGAFDASGVATEGPPAAAKQALRRFPLRVEQGLLFIEVSLDSIFVPQEASQTP